MKQITLEAKKQRISRNVRADCNADTIVLSILFGAEFEFNKTKDSCFAEKVYVAEKAYIENTVKCTDDILSDGLLFECALRELWNEKKKIATSSLDLNYRLVKEIMSKPSVGSVFNEKISILFSEAQTNSNVTLWGSVQSSIDDVESGCCLRKRKTKNKESAFNNFLSHFLINKGVTLCSNNLARKMCMKTLNFFIWKQYILPDGRRVSSEKLKPITTLLRSIIKKVNQHSHSIIVNKTTLEMYGLTDELLRKCGLDYFVNHCCRSPIIKYQTYESECMSVFTPCPEALYSIVN